MKSAISCQEYERKMRGRKRKSGGRVQRNEVEKARTWKETDPAVLLDKCQEKNDRPGEVSKILSRSHFTGENDGLAFTLLYVLSF